MNSLLYNNLLPKIENKNETTILIFSIGCFPSNKLSKHDDPTIFHTLKKNNDFKIYRIFIDSEYKKMSDDNIEQKFKSNYFVVKEDIDKRNYFSIIDFCNFASHFNCLSIIMEFTNIDRFPINNINEYVYICPNNCFGQVDLPLYNPIIEYSNDKYQFYLPTKELLYPELRTLLLFNMNETIVSKIEFIKFSIILKFMDINNIYRKILNYMKLKESFTTNYNKSNKNSLDRSLKQIVYRMGGYYENKTKSVFENFLNSTEKELENYIKNIIQTILIDCLYLENNGEDLTLKEQEFDKIMFSNDNELRDIINNYQLFFKDIINKLSL